MIDVLYFSDRQVNQKLFARVTAAKKLLLVTAVPPHRATQVVARLSPYAELEADHAALLDQVLVVDEGSVDGMWRDPLTALADALYPDDTRAAYGASRGYVFVEAGKARAWVKRHGSATEDLWFLREALAKLSPRVDPPDPARRPGRRKKPPSSRPGQARAERTAEDEPVEAPGVRPLGRTPYEVLGLARGCTLSEGQKAYRALIVQYHPDKVAHLADEFRQLAEARTREILAAWQQLESELSD